MNTPFHLVVVDEASILQINRMHELLKQRAPGNWWHHFANAWIVGGDLTAAQWREVIAPALEAGPASALVVRLPGDAAELRDWAYFGIEMSDRLEWLDEKLGRAPHGSPARTRVMDDRQQRKG